MFIDERNSKYGAEKKLYFVYKISFNSEKKREIFVNKVKSISMQTGKSIPDIIYDSIIKES